MSQLFDPAFRIIRMAADGITALGYIRAAEYCNTREVLDQPGSLSFSIPAADEQSVQITAGSYFHAYDEQDGDLGLFVYQSSNIADNNGVAYRRVNCVSVMIELARTTTKFNRNFTNHDVAQVVNTLAQIATGWSTNCDAGMGNTAVDYQGESLLSAIDTLRERFKKHYRMQRDFDRRLEFGALGEDSGVRIVNKEAAPAVIQNINPNVVLTDKPTYNEDAESIVNRVIAVGSGQGTAQVTLADSTYAGTYAVQTGVNPDGSNYYYIEDAASIAAYGLHEQTIVYQDVRPITNSDAGKENAANEIHKSAEAELIEFKDPHITYDVSTINLPGTVQVGDKVRLRYRGQSDGNTYLDVNELVFITEINRQRRADGSRSQKLSLGSNAEPKMTDSKLVASAVKKATIRETHPQAYPYFNFIPFTHPVGYGGGVAWDATLRFIIDENVTSIDNVKLRFYCPLIFLGIFQQIGVSNQIYFGPSYSNTYLAGLNLWIDGVNVTADYGGPWSMIPGISGIDEELDITEKIVSSPFGLYAEHVIQFITWTTITGNVALPGEPIVNGDRNFAQINVEVRTRGTAQAIITT